MLLWTWRACVGVCDEWVCNGQQVCQFYRCLAFARFWEVKVWRSFIKCQYFSHGWTDFHKKIYIYLYLYLGHFFRNPEKNSGLTPGQNDDPVTRWPGHEDDPNDPLTRWPSDPVPCLVSSVCDEWVPVRQRRVYQRRLGMRRRERLRRFLRWKTKLRSVVLAFALLTYRFQNYLIHRVK